MEEEGDVDAGTKLELELKADTAKDIAETASERVDTLRAKVEVARLLNSKRSSSRWRVDMSDIFHAVQIFTPPDAVRVGRPKIRSGCGETLRRKE